VGTLRMTGRPIFYMQTDFYVCQVQIRTRIQNIMKFCNERIVRYWFVGCGANSWFGGWFGGFPYPVNPGRPEWSKVQTRGKPLVATAQAKYVSAGE